MTTRLKTAQGIGYDANRHIAIAGGGYLLPVAREGYRCFSPAGAPLGWKTSFTEARDMVRESQTPKAQTTIP